MRPKLIGEILVQYKDHAQKLTSYSTKCGKCYKKGRKDELVSHQCS